VRTLSSEDALFLYMETPEHHQHVVATMVLGPSTAPGAVAMDNVIDAFAAIILQLPAFRQKLVKVPLAMTPPVLVEDPHFVFRNHIHRIAVPAPGTRAQLAALVEDIASTPLSSRRPLWEAWFISELENDRVAVVLKSHHCLADGVNGIASIAQLFDLEPAPPPADKRLYKSKQHHRPPVWGEITYRALLSQWRYQPGYLSVLNRTVRSATRRHKLFSASSELSELVPSPLEEAPRLKFNGPVSASRIAALGSVPLADVKRIKKALSVTINDVVVAACTLGLRQYLIATNDLPDQPLICCLPVSLALKGHDGRRPGQGNQVGAMPVLLPVHIEDPAQLIQFVCRATRAAKQVFDECFENLLLDTIGAMPPTLADWAVKGFIDRRIVERAPTTTNLVISNLPGPPVPLYLGGARMEAAYGMGPVLSGQGPNITVISYADQMQFSLLACRELMPEIGLLAERIESAFAQLLVFAVADRPKDKKEVTTT